MARATPKRALLFALRMILSPPELTGVFPKAITEDQEGPTIASALVDAPRVGLKATGWKKILREVFTIVSSWRKIGRQLRLKAPILDTYASAFEHPLMDEARQILGK